MFGITKLLASVSLILRQPLDSFCEIETTHGTALVTKQSDYITFLRIDGLRRQPTRAEVERIANAQRLDLSGTLENTGHAIVGFYISDPDLAAVEIERVNMEGCRGVARELGLDLTDILAERSARWPKMMRWEAAYYVLWTRRGVLTKEERKQMKEEQDALARECPLVGSSQRYYLRSEVMAARHTAFVARVDASLHGHGIATTELKAHDALKVIRETIYRETAGSPWKATLQGDRVMPRLPEEHVSNPKPEGLLWPSIGSQIFHADAETQGGQRVRIGEYEYAHVDMRVGPEEPRPFIELAAPLGRDRLPWRATFVIEGGGKMAMTFKEIGAKFLGMFPQNADLRRAFEALAEAKARDNHISVRLRASFATWAPAEETRKLRRRASSLSQRLEGWGNCKATSMAGDPLEGTLSSVPGLALASTGVPHAALLGDAFAMLPWARTANPWQRGSVLFRKPDGAMAPYDPTGGAIRPQVLDIFVAPPRSGKSVLANTINLGLCLSSAVLGSHGARLPLIGKSDIGNSAEGFVRLVQEALGPARRHEAIFVTMQLSAGFEFNVFDLQVGCEYPMPLERAFLQNFLELATLPPNETKPFEGMGQLIQLIITEAYRRCTGVPGGAPKRYRAGLEPNVDEAMHRHRIELKEDDPWWRDVVNELIAVREYRWAEVAQRHAVPTIQDLISAVRTDQVKDSFNGLKIAATHENLGNLFERYVYDFIRKFPTLSQPTKLDFGPARVIVMDLAAVAPTGSAAADRQTEMMYMMSRHILGRNFFLHTDHLDYIPEAVRPYHRVRFQDAMETIKRLDFDEWHRTANSPQVQAQAERDMREGPKHNVQLGFASQRLKDMSPAIISQSTGRFVLKAGDVEEAEEIIQRFGLGEASANNVRHTLSGPGPGGAPFLAQFTVDADKWEQLLVNSLGPVELWALSTTPGDSSLRNRLYGRLGFSEALRRLSRVFPFGSAEKEITQRKDDRLKRGEKEDGAAVGVLDELANELTNGTGLGIVLRDVDLRREAANDPSSDQPSLIAAE